MRTVPSSAATTGPGVDDAVADVVGMARIRGVRFGLPTAEAIERAAGAVITEHSLFNKNMPKLGSPNDPGMGPCDRRVVCSTCRNGWFTCPQHMGVLRLPIPVFNPVHFETTLRVLQAVCFSCCRVLQAVTDATTAAAPASRTVCATCGLPQPKYKRGGHLVIRREWSPKKLAEVARRSPATAAAAERMFTAADALQVFLAMGPEDIRAVGMDPVASPPAALIMQNLCVLPPAARPTVMAAEGSKRRGPDNNTTQLQNLTKAIRSLVRGMNGGTGPTGKGSLVNPPTGADACSEFKLAAGGREARQGFVSWTPKDVATLREVLDDAVAVVTPEVCATVWAQFPQLAERVQNEVATIVNNSGRYAPIVKQRTGVPQRSLQARLVGKTGRMRCNVFAKRSDQTARAVIRPDRALDIDEIGVPWSFMTTLTRPEVVHAGNVARLSAAVAAGPGVRGGAARVLRADGTLVQLHLWQDSSPLRLQPGDLVERHLVDGDMVLLNRQPTLHRLSLMGHRVVGVPGDAICVPLGVMGPYNADCDGDEENIHVVQSLGAEAEVRLLMSVGANVINPQTNAPCISLVQDARVGAMLLTRSSTRLTKAVAAACMAAIHYKLRGKEVLPDPAGGTCPVTGQPLWTGRQLVSAIIPAGVFMDKWVRGGSPGDGPGNGPDTPDSPDDRHVVIVNGELRSGALCKASLGTVAGGLVHRIFLTCGSLATLRFLSDFQRLVYTWLPTFGLTVSLKDCVAPVGTTLSIKAASAATNAVVEDLQRRVMQLSGAGAMTPTEVATVEAHILTVVSATLDFTSRCVLQAQRADSGFAAMVTAGSKGSASNPAQVMGALGQQVVDGERPPPDPVSLRTLPAFPVGALSAASRGFIMSSFLDGTSPTEYFNHMQAGREGLVSTAVKTATTGYMFRAEAKGAEGNRAEHDGTTRNAQGYILEFVTGGDGLNPCAVVQVDMRHALFASAAAVRRRLVHDAVVQVFLGAQARLRRGYLTPLFPTGTAAAKVLVPCDLQNELVTLRHDLATGRVQRKGVAAAAAAAAAVTGEAAMDTATAVLGLVDVVRQFLTVPETADAMVAYVLWQLCPEALRDAGLDLNTDGPLVAGTLGAALRSRLGGALVHPGELVGVIAAHSVGEPATQLTLNAFHHAGMLTRRMTVGVPRLQELTTGTSRIKTPTTTVAMRVRMAPEAAAAAAATLQFLCLSNAVQKSYVVLDPPAGPAPARPTVLIKDTALVQHARTVFGCEPANASPWVIRLVLQRALLQQHQFTPEGVARALGRQLPADTAVVVAYSEPNMPQWVVRVRLLNNPEQAGARVLHAFLLDSVLLGGIEHVRAVRVIELPCMVEAAPAAAAAAAAAAEAEEKEEKEGLVASTVQGMDMEGVALRALATRDWVDWTTAVTNDVVATMEVLGMVAARAVLFAELDRVLTSDGGYVDARHLAQLVVTMTHRGFIMALSRHGINRTDFSVLHRASFEEPVDHLQAAAAAGTVDPLRGLSECIYVGSKAPIGTGTVAVQEDIDADAPQMLMQARHSVVSRELHGSRGRGLKRGVREPLGMAASHRRRVTFASDLKPKEHGAAPENSSFSHLLQQLRDACACVGRRGGDGDGGGGNGDFTIVTTGPNGAIVTSCVGNIVAPPLPPVPETAAPPLNRDGDGDGDGDGYGYGYGAERHDAFSPVRMLSPPVVL